MIENKKLTIGGDSIIIQSLPATRSASIGFMLLKIIGGVGAGVSDISFNMKELAQFLHAGKMVQGLLANIDADGTAELIRDIIRESVVQPSFEGQPSKAFIDWYENRFSMELQDLLVLLVEIFQHNYGNPLEWLKKMEALMEGYGWLAPSAPELQGENTESEPAN